MNTIGSKAGDESGNGAATGTCFTAGPVAFTDTGKALIEVIEVPSLSPVGGTQPWFIGLAVYRSELLPVTDFTHWAGLSNAPFNALAKQTAGKHSVAKNARENYGSSRRILVVQHRGGTGTQGEKVGLLDDDVSGHVSIEQSVMEMSGRDSIVQALHRQLDNAGGANEALLQLIKGAWLSNEPVFVVDLQQLFNMKSFTSVALPAQREEALH